jgi:hypothetical protein
MQADDNETGRTCSCPDKTEMAEHGVMTRLLYNESPDPWTRAELERDIDVGPLAVGDALANLCGLGVIHINGGLVTASKAARRMHELDDRF